MTNGPVHETHMLNIVDQLQELHLFRNVERKDLEKLVMLCQVINFPVGQTIYAQGSDAKDAMILLSGRLEVSVRTPISHRHLGDIHPGEIFGEQGLFHSDGSRNATVIANQDSFCLLVTSTLMRETWNNQAIVALEKHLIATMARRIRNTNRAILKVWKDSEKEKIKDHLIIVEQQEPSLIEKIRSLFWFLYSKLE
jgi:CRP-like cAMP-binding protein